MKKGVLVVFIFAFLLMGLSFGSALLTGEKEAVDNAYACLRETIDDKTCASLPIEEQIFALLSVGKCKDEVIAAQLNGECWAGTKTAGCDLKTTALATLALDRVKENTNDSQEWLLNRKVEASNIQWMLEIDTPVESDCTTGFDGTDYLTRIYADKKVTMVPQTCFSLFTGGYWFNIDRRCYPKEFEISCDENFLTTLLFKNPSYPTIYVLDEVHSSSAGGKTIEQVKSYCFGDLTGKCDYEGSLWSSWVLDYLNNDVSDIIPYLIVRAVDFPELMPEVFLYALIGKLEYKTKILSGQIIKKYWKVDQNKFYDTALALLPFQIGDLAEKINSKVWLMDEQGPDGCWDNKNIWTNGFLLYSIWPNQLGGGNGGGGSEKDDDNCVDLGYYCVGSSYSCTQAGGLTLIGYDCPGIQKCCDTPEKITLCSDLQGEICASNEYCQGGSEQTTDDLKYGESCCVQGSCQKTKPPIQNTCEIDTDGICEPYSCTKGYGETSTYTCDSGNICCVKEAQKSYWWLWLLFALIVLVTLAILFRDKLQDLVSGKGKPAPKSGPRSPPNYPRNPQMIPPQRRMMPPSSRPPMRRPAPQRAPKELDDVLDKLKKMSSK